MARRKRAPKVAPTRSTPLPTELLAAILAHLSPADRVSAACCSKEFAAAALLTVRRLAVDVDSPCKRWPPALRELVLLRGADPARISGLIAALDEEAGPEGGEARKFGGAIAATLRGLVRAAPLHARAASSRVLTLTLAIPGLVVAPRQLERLLGAGEGGALFSEVSVASGVVTLDGSLRAQLVRATLRAAAAVPWLTVGGDGGGTPARGGLWGPGCGGECAQHI